MESARSLRRLAVALLLLWCDTVLGFIAGNAEEELSRCRADLQQARRVDNLAKEFIHQVETQSAATARPTTDQVAKLLAPQGPTASLDDADKAEPASSSGATAGLVGEANGALADLREVRKTSHSPRRTLDEE